MAVPISNLVPQVQSRLEEFAGPTGDGEFWSIQWELRTALIEAMNDLLLLIGRPTQTVNLPFNLTPNTVWQTVPKGLLLITDIWGWGSRLRKCDLHSLDYVMANWTPEWENDTDPAGPTKWAPLGFNMFLVHPATSVPQTVTLTAIAYPVTDTYPYTGAETIPYHDECLAALEAYAAHYCRLKESGSEAQQSLQLYRDYLAVAERLTQIESRRDPVIFSKSFGAAAGLDSLVKR